LIFVASNKNTILVRGTVVLLTDLVSVYYWKNGLVFSAEIIDWC